MIQVHIYSNNVSHLYGAVLAIGYGAVLAIGYGAVLTWGRFDRTPTIEIINNTVIYNLYVHDTMAWV